MTDDQKENMKEYKKSTMRQKNLINKMFNLNNYNRT